MRNVSLYFITLKIVYLQPLTVSSLVDTLASCDPGPDSKEGDKGPFRCLDVLGSSQPSKVGHK